MTIIVVLKKNTTFFLYEDPRSKSWGLINVCVCMSMHIRKRTMGEREEVLQERRKEDYGMHTIKG